MNLVLETEQYTAARYPGSGNHILAYTTDNLIVVYQAYKYSIANYAVKHQRLAGPEYSLQRMSWIKPNFLWMMYRSGWATKPDQERVLAFWITKAFFDRVLENAAFSSFNSNRFENVDEWRRELELKEARLQWDPDHDPFGRPLERRAIQLGLKGNLLREFATTAALHIEDITPFVIEQSRRIADADQLLIPVERVYVPASAHVRHQISLDTAL